MSGHLEDAVRRGCRFPAGVVASFPDAGQIIHCTAVNVSRSGALIVGAFTTPSAEPLELTLKTPNGLLSLTLPARIIRVTPDPDGNQLAVEFVDVDDVRRDRIEVFLARLLEAPQPGPLESLRPNAPPPEVKKALDAIPLPQRIALAQRAELKQREYLRQDQHPAVLEAVVRNPNLTLPEARAIAGLLGLPGTAIDLLAADPRFKNDEELRMALATQAKVLLPIAEKLTADLKPPQIRKLLARPGIHPTLREKLFKKMTRG
ncbi:MAG TPA: PilZ domain-containing protein [Candidatus Polarisedimenticolaceae bacterium]|nr:PilZ domain-containing protein [Candidatus Polarisedimenticolaceae bacterium]